MLKDTPLGQQTVYAKTYAPELLYPVPRALARKDLTELPFHGLDIWNAYEVSWLNIKGKPEIAIVEFSFPYNTKNIVESKSLKLYLNSLNNSPFTSSEEIKDVIEKDLSNVIVGPVGVVFYSLSAISPKTASNFEGTCLDSLDIQTDTYDLDPSFLKTSSAPVQETLWSNLLKSNCLATGQPDWASVLIRYSGKKIDHEGLLKYIISYRNHSGFAEHCVEQIYMDILERCQPDQLTVYARYTRRGGIDINPFRSNFETLQENTALIRQ